MPVSFCKESTCKKLFEIKGRRKSFCSSQCCRKFHNRQMSPKYNLSYMADIEKDEEEFEDQAFLIKVFQRMTGRAYAV